tara:strand:- start:17 stop:196 length:180 start_codon:yes stop_codon:yes gene_type:complete
MVQTQVNEMEIFIILVVIGLAAIFWKVIVALFAAMGGLFAIIVPIAIICAVIYIITLIF